MNSRRLTRRPPQARAAHYHTVAQERRCASQQKLRADVADGSGAPNWCRSQHFRFTPTSRRRADIVEPPVSAITSCEQMQQVAPLFDDFVGSREQCSRHFEAESFGGLHVEPGFLFRLYLPLSTGWFLSFQSPLDS